MSFPANVIPVFGSQRAYADLNFAGGSFGLNGGVVNNPALLPGFTFTGASLRTMFDSTGAMTYGPNNLLLQSQTFGTTWVTQSASVSSNVVAAPDGTLTADKLTEDNTTNNHKATQVVTTAVGTRYVGSVSAKAGERSILALRLDGLSNSFAWFDLSAGTVLSVQAAATASITSAGNGWYRCSVSATGTATNHGLETYTAIANGSTSYLGDGTSGIYLWGAQLEAVTYRTTPAAYMPTTSAAYYGPRLVYDPVTLASLGILVEEARTNVCLWNRDLTNAAWVHTTMTAAKNQTGIDGVANSASSLTATGAAATTLQTIVLASSTRQQSAYVKRLTGTGVVNMTTDGVTWTAITLTAAWTRVTIPAQAAVVNPVLGFQIMTSGDAIAVDCVQNEAVSGASISIRPSSPIVTTSAATTRSADWPFVTGLSVGPDATVVFEGVVPYFVSSDARTTLSDGTTDNRLYANCSGSTLGVNRAVGGSAGSLGTAAGTPTTPFKSGISSASGRYAGSINGSAPTPGSAGAMPTLTRLDIGTNVDGNERWGATISRIRIYNRALSDAQLQALTA